MTEKSITLPVLRDAAKLARRRCWQAMTEIDGIMGGVKLRLAGMPYSKRQKFLGEVFDQLKPYLAVVSTLPAPPPTLHNGAEQEGDARCQGDARHIGRQLSVSLPAMGDADDQHG